MTESTRQPTDPAESNDQARPGGEAQTAFQAQAAGQAQPSRQELPAQGAQPSREAQRVDAAAMRRRSGIFRVVNVPMRAVLSLPFPTPLSRNLMLVRYTGRKSGRVYRQPLSYARDGAALLTPGGGRWTLNMESGRPVRIRLRGRDVSARPELVREPGEVERLLDVIVAENPPAARFIPLPRQADGRLEPTALAAALDHGFAIVRWNLT
jgi:hypothetical protein